MRIKVISNVFVKYAMPWWFGNAEQTCLKLLKSLVCASHQVSMKVSKNKFTTSLLHCRNYTEVILSIGSIHIYGKGIMDIIKYSDLDQQVWIIMAYIVNCDYKIYARLHVDPHLSPSCVLTQVKKRCCSLSDTSIYQSEQVQCWFIGWRMLILCIWG